MLLEWLAQSEVGGGDKRTTWQCFVDLVVLGTNSGHCTCRCALLPGLFLNCISCSVYFEGWIRFHLVVLRAYFQHSSGLTSGHARETICRERDYMWVGCGQGNCFTQSVVLNLAFPDPVALQLNCELFPLSLFLFFSPCYISRYKVLQHLSEFPEDFGIYEELNIEINSLRQRQISEEYLFNLRISSSTLS